MRKKFLALVLAVSAAIIMPSAAFGEEWDSVAEEVFSDDAEESAFTDADDEVFVSDGETLETDPVQSGTVGLNVASHTLEEVVAYLKNNGVTYHDKVAYAEEPSLVVPYSAGALSDETQSNAIKMLNNVRYIAGLDEVTLDTVHEAAQQTGCLVDAVNNQLSHTPAQPSDMDAEMYRLGYSGTSSANLGAGYSTLNSAIIYGWMNDSDSGNISAVGHRRWCLNPVMGKTVFGMAGIYSSMYAFDTSNTDAAQTYVSWPAQTMPIEYFGDDYAWSVSVGKTVTASAVKVTLVRESDNASWNFSSTSADGYFNVNNEGYGQPGCIIFRPDFEDDFHYSDGDVFTVTITGLEETVSYTVRFFELDRYWHKHYYDVDSYSWGDDYTTADVVYKCSCGDTYTKTVSVTCERLSEPDCVKDGSDRYSFDDGSGGTFSVTRTVGALGHSLASCSLSDNVITGTCSRCGTVVQKGVITDYFLWWSTDAWNYTSYRTSVHNVGTTYYFWYTDLTGGNDTVTDLDTQFVIESSDESVMSVTRTASDMGALSMKEGGTVSLTIYPRYNPSLKRTFKFTVYCADGDHTATVQNAKEASSTKAGYTGDTVCSRCKKVLAKGGSIPATGTLTVKLSKLSYIYNGKAQKPSVTVLDPNGNPLGKSEYTVKYSGDGKAVGIYQITVTLTEDSDYAGTLTATYSIKPKGTTITKITAGKKRFAITWKKAAGQITGYQIQYSTNRKFTAASTKTIARKKGITWANVKNLISGKKYYVRVRTYKKTSGGYVYSSWSKIRNVKTK